MQVKHRNVNEASQDRHMDVVKVVVSECVLRLGRVRMTYLFVAEPGMSMYGSGWHRHFKGFKNMKHVYLTVALTVPHLITAGEKESKVLQKSAINRTEVCSEVIWVPCPVRKTPNFPSKYRRGFSSSISSRANSQVVSHKLLPGPERPLESLVNPKLDLPEAVIEMY